MWISDTVEFDDVELFVSSMNFCEAAGIVANEKERIVSRNSGTPFFMERKDLVEEIISFVERNSLAFLARGLEKVWRSKSAM